MKSNFLMRPGPGRNRLGLAIIAWAAAFFPISLSSATITIVVPATANPWLAGMSDGTTTIYGDVAPDQSPTLVSGLELVSGSVLTFSASGSVRQESTQPFDGPDGRCESAGCAGEGYPSENGISEVVSLPLMSLVGVFLGPDQPNLSPAPDGLDFVSLGRDFTVLSPLLKQVFPIGDGLTTTGTVQQFIVPAGAARLYLGTMDGYNWNDDAGSFTVQIIPPLPPCTGTNEPTVRVRFYPAIQLDGDVGCRYAIQFSSSLQSPQWRTVTNILLETSPFTFFGTTAIDTQPYRFYRAVKVE